MTLRDPLGRGFWIKRSEAGMREVDRDCFQLLSYEGKLLEGNGRTHSEWHLHSQILLARADAMVSVHTHAEWPTLLSCYGEPMRLLTTDAGYLGSVQVFDSGTSQIDTKALGERVAEALGSERALLLQNHGTVFVGSSIEQATLIGYYLVRAARADLRARAAGNSFRQAPASSATARSAMLNNPGWLRDSFDCLRTRLQSQLAFEGAL
jgi:ribulose-5-phosphate 4-epimerase/fuculose-1-phosphate aldolase